MRCLVVSDIHGRLKVAKKLADLFDSAKPDKIIVLGDNLYNGPRNGVPEDYDPMGVADILNRYADKIIGIRGNCDSRVDEAVLRFRMQDSRVVYVNGFRCDLIHGDLLTSNLLQVERGDILMYGHTHIPMLKREDGVIYLNPGSPSFPKNGFPPSYAIFDRGLIKVLSLDDDTPIYELEAR